MPEASLLEGIQDDHDRSVMEAQLKTLQDEQHRRRQAQKANSVSSITRDTFTVYDCSHSDSVHRPILLLEPDECSDIELTHWAPVNVSVQVVETGSSILVTAYKCLLTVSREVSRCGFDSIHYGTVVSELDTPQHLTPSQCRQAVLQKFTFERQFINVTLNSPVVHSYYSFGKIDDDHECSHTSFTSNGRYFTDSYESTIVRAYVTTVKERYNLATGRIILANGLVGNYADKIILDDTEGKYVWSSNVVSCQDKISDVYTGPAKLFPKQNNTLVGQPGDLVLVEEHNKERFAGLVLKSLTRVCGPRACRPWS